MTSNSHVCLTAGLQITENCLRFQYSNCQYCTSVILCKGIVCVCVDFFGMVCIFFQTSPQKIVTWHKSKRTSRQQGTVIIWSPKILHKVAIELFTVWMGELSCWKKIIPSPMTYISEWVVKEFVPHTFLDVLVLNILVPKLADHTPNCVLVLDCPPTGTSAYVVT